MRVSDHLKKTRFLGGWKKFLSYKVSLPFSANLEEVVAGFLTRPTTKCHNLVEVGNDFGFLPQVAR